MQKVNIGIIGTGWCGGIRAETCAASPYVSELHIAEIKEARLREVAEKTRPATATADYHELLANKNINAIVVSATPETVHYPMAKETLLDMWARWGAWLDKYVKNATPVNAPAPAAAKGGGQ